MNSTLLAATDLKKHFHTRAGTVRAADGVSFEIRETETLGLVGESGSGKSTIAYTIVGIYRPTAGKLMFRAQDIGRESVRRSRRLKKEIQIVFQDPGSSLNPRQSIRQILDLPLRVHKAGDKRHRQEQILRLLEMVELPQDYLYKYPALWPQTLRSSSSTSPLPPSTSPYKPKSSICSSRSRRN
jgi:peptide/nickel transport system ATP-binding protein